MRCHPARSGRRGTEGKDASWHDCSNLNPPGQILAWCVPEGGDRAQLKGPRMCYARTSAEHFLSMIRQRESHYPTRAPGLAPAVS